MQTKERQETRQKRHSLDSFTLCFSIQGWNVEIQYPFIKIVREGRPEEVTRGNYWWKHENNIEEAITKAKQYTTLLQIKADYCL